MCGLWVLAEGHPLGPWSTVLHKAYYTLDLAEPPGLSLPNLWFRSTCHSHPRWLADPGLSFFCVLLTMSH